MRIVSSECLIIRNQDYRERDRLVTFLARDAGKRTGIARGSRKLTARGVGSFELFSHGEIFYTEKTGSELVSIRKLDPVPPYLFLEGNYDKFLLAGYMSEWIYLCPIQKPEAEAYFLLLRNALQSLTEEQTSESLFLARLDFQMDLMTLLGVQPDWNACMNCERPLLEKRGGRATPLMEGTYQLDVREGRLRCPECHGHGSGQYDLAAGSLAFLAAWREPGRSPGLRPTKRALADLLGATTAQLIHHTEKEPRSLGMLPHPLAIPQGNTP